MTFTNLYIQINATFLLSLIPAYDLEFPGGISNDNVRWRAVMWLTSELLLLLAVLPNYLPGELLRSLAPTVLCLPLAHLPSSFCIVTGWNKHKLTKV